MKKKSLITAIIALILLTAFIGVACNTLKSGDVKSFTVVFMDGDSTLKEAEVRADVDLVNAFTPEKEGYTFEGWFSDAGCITPATAATENAKFYAKWSKKTYSVVFKDKDDNILSSQTVDYGKDAVEPSIPEVDGFTFVRWSAEFTSVKTNITVKALYSQNQYKLSFKNGAEEIFTVDLYSNALIGGAANSALDGLTTPTGFDFAAWIDADGNPVDIDTAAMPDKNLTLFAKMKLAPLGEISSANASYVYGSSNASATFSAVFTEYQNDSISYVYEWYRGSALLGTGKTYTASGYDAGTAHISLKVTASAEGYTSVTSETSCILTVAKGTLTGFSAENVVATYDAGAHGITVNGTEEGDKIFYSTNGLNWVSSLTYTNSGDYKAYFMVSRKNYNDYVSAEPVSIKINKAVLTVTADDKTIIYGDNFPNFTVNITGFLGNDDSSVISGAANVAHTDSNKKIGDTPLSPSAGTLAADNYSFVFDSGTLHIIKRNATVTAAILAPITYGDAVPALSADTLGTVFGDTINYTLATTYEQFSDVGSYAITVVLGSNPNYNVTVTDGSFAVAKKAATVTADGHTAITYGDAVPADFTANVDGTINGDTLAYTLSTDYAQFNGVGSYNITVVLGANDNYDVTVVNSSFNVDKKDATVTANGHTAITYGDAVPADFTASVDGAVNGDTLAYTLSTDYAQFNGVGSYNITVTAGTNSNYNVTIVNTTFTVNKKAATVTADGHTDITYGDAVPADFTASVDGAVNGDTLAYTLFTDYAQFNGVGNYNITVELGTYTNYTVTATNGSFAVAKKAATVTADGHTDITYGDDVPTNFTASVDGAVNDDKINYSLTTNYTKFSGVGSYNITVELGINDNYDVTAYNANFAVTQKSITISASDRISHDGNPWTKTISALDGLIGDDVISGTISTKSAEVGTYTDISDFEWTTPLTITNNGVSALDNYIVFYSLNVVIETRTFNYTDGKTEVSYDGAPHGGSVATTDLADYSVTYGTAAGEYTLFSAPQYTNAGTYTVYFHIVDNTDEATTASGSYSIIIHRKNATVTAATPDAITYGDAAPALSAVTSGVIAGDTLNYTLTTNYAQFSDVGSYAITVVLDSNPNYNVTAKGSSFTVKTKAATVTANGHTAITYGDAVPTDFTASVDGAVNGDTINYTLSTNYTQFSGVGSYNITVELGINDNYSVTVVNSTFNVDKKAATVTANGHTAITYGDAVPTDFTASVDGAVNGNTINYTLSTNYTQFSSFGSYAITVVLGANPNYSVTVVNSTFNVDKKAATVTANGHDAITYGDAVPSDFSAKVDGAVNGDIINYTLSTNYTQFSDVGSYNITVTAGTNANYDVTVVNATFTVNKKSAAVTWTGTDGVYTYNGSIQSGISATYNDINGISANAVVTYKKGGAVAEFITAGTYLLTSSTADGNYTLTNATSSAVINKASYTSATAHPAINDLTYTPNIKLSDIALAENYGWQDGNTFVYCPTTGYAAYYNADPANYENFALTITVNLKKANVTIGGTTVQEFNYDGNSHTFDTTQLSNSVNANGTYSGDLTYTAAGTYGFTVTFSSDNYSGSTTGYMKVKGAKIGDNYYTIEDALNTAVSGKTIIITTDTSFADHSLRTYLYNNDSYYTVKSGVTLLVPYDANFSTKDEYKDDSLTLGSPYVKLTIPQKITLNVLGTLNVNALRGNNGNTKSGHTIENYGLLDLQSGAVINVKQNAVLNSSGYIIGEGNINLESGATAYEPLAMKDWRGGTVAKEIYKTVFPFQQFCVSNIEAHLNVYSGSKLYSRCLIYIPTFSMTKETNLLLIGSSGLFECTAGYISKSVNVTTGKTIIDVYGTINTNSITMSIAISFLSSIKIDTTNLEIPLCGYYDVNIKSGSNATIKNRFKLLPGATMTVDEGATLTIQSNAKLFVFSDPSLFKTGGGNAYGGTICAQNTRLNKQVYSASMPAVFTVNGTLDIQSGASFGGVITSASSTGSVSIASGANLNDTFKQLNSSSEYTYDDVNIKAQGYTDGGTSLSILSSGIVYFANSDKRTWST